MTKQKKSKAELYKISNPHREVDEIPNLLVEEVPIRNKKKYPKNLRKINKGDLS